MTDKSMTRFNISIIDAVKMVDWSIKNAKGGEIFVPKIPSYKITDLAKSICPHNKINIIGIRPGEKLHEELITKSDSELTVDLGRYYAILPNIQFYKKYITKFKAKKINLVPVNKVENMINFKYSDVSGIIIHGGNDLPSKKRNFENSLRKKLD